MALSLAELVAPKTLAQTRAEAIGVLSGRGIVTKGGEGSGSVTLSGTPSQAADVVLRIVAGGELGVATYEISADGGTTWSSPAATIPANGQVNTGLGITAAFAAGPGASGSFVAGDTFRFRLTVPTFSADSWRADDTPRVMLEIEAQGRADHSALAARIAGMGLLDLAEGSWLKLLARSRFGLEYNRAVVAKGSVQLAAASGAGPFTIAPGQLWFAAANGLRYRAANTEPMVLAQSSSIFLPVAAEAPGAAYNVAAGTITTMVTPLAGVTVTNPGPNWLTTPGVDEESDASLRARCRARWSELGVGKPGAAYELWAKTASPSVTRVLARPSDAIAGQVDVYLAGPAGGVGPEIIAAVQAYIGPRVPLGIVPLAVSAEPRAIAITATLHGRAQYEAAAKLAAQAALEALIASVPVGGRVYVAALIEALMSPAGVENVVLAAPAGDVVLTAAQVATLSLAPLAWANT